MTVDIYARGFPRELDGHPQLRWMGEDWVTFVILTLRERLVAQDEGSELKIVRCAGEPALETRVDPDGYVGEVELSVRLALLMRDGRERFWWLEGPATFSSTGSVSFDIDESRRDTLVDVFAEARGWIERGGGDTSEVEAALEALQRGELPDATASPPADGAVEPEHLTRLAERHEAARALRAVHRCSACGAVAARLFAEDGRLTRAAFTGVLTQALSPEAERALHHPRALHGLDPELAPHFCPVCDATYCGTHWERWDVFDEQGFHDCIRGRCPHGHERLLED